MALLNNVDHKGYKVITQKSASYGHQVGNTLTFPTEYIDVQREYPIVFHKTDEGYQSVALLGFNSDENLFLDESGWHADYVPAAIEKGPFVIGLQRQQNSDEPKVMVNIDMADPRVNKDEGHELFLEMGGNSPYLEKVCKLLGAINDGVAMSRDMFAVFEKLELIEPVTLEYTLANGEKHQLGGFHSINQDRLSSLKPEEVLELYASGFMQAAYLVVSSLANVKKLIQMKNERLQTA